VSDDFPGWVEIHLDLADGTVAKFIDKWPMFTSDDCLRPDASYPFDLPLDCTVSAEKDGTAAGPGTVYVTMTHVDDVAGMWIFLVREQDVLPDDST
jgi:hypothetical protein